MANENKKVTNSKNKNTKTNNKTVGATKKTPAKKTAAKKTTTAKKVTTANTKTTAAKKVATANTKTTATKKTTPKKKNTATASKKTNVVTSKKAAKKVVNTVKGKTPAKKTTPKKVANKVEKKVIEPKKVVEPKKEIEIPKVVEKSVPEKKEEKKVTLSTNTLYTIIGLGVLAIVIVLSFVIKPSNSEYKESGKTTVGNGESPATQEEIPEDKRKELNSISIDQYLEMLKGEEAKVIYIGRPTCGHCVAQKPIMENIKFEYDVEINYLNTDELNDEGINKLITSNEYFSEGFGTPLTLIVKNNDIVDKAVGETSKKDMVAMFKKNSLIK